MTKKHLVWQLLPVLVAAASIAGAQPARHYRVGVLGPPGNLDERPPIRGLRDGLNEAGYTEGRNLKLNLPHVQSYDALRAVVQDYVENKEDVIVTHGATATGIAQKATKEIPIVFIWEVLDPVQSGLVESAAHPKTNMTGLSSFAGSDISGKRLELFKEVVPALRRVALLYNARGESPDHARRLEVVRSTAPKLGLKLTERPIKSGAQAIASLFSVSRESTDGIFMISSGLFAEPCGKLAAIAIQKKLPLTGCIGTADEGVLSIYEADGYRNGQRGAWYVDKILKGRKPQDLPVEAPGKFEWVINLKTAKQIGLTVPQNVLVRADRIVR
jgi:ABC-type uncharacterized transport system substrate-binding protein